MQRIEHNTPGNPGDLTQLQLWPDDQMPEAQQIEQAESEEDQIPPIQGYPLATQLYLPGFEPK